ncbi:MAG: NUDIX domain-containing protein [Gemmatimonadaceae bacterium]
MTEVRVGVVDVCVMRMNGRACNVLVLRRAKGTRSPGSWELVHGHIEKGELPVGAARRELREETGLATDKLYSITVNPFYLLASDTVQVALVFAAIVESERVVIGAEHDRHEWLSVAAAAKRLTWPRDAESLRQARQLLRSGDAGVVEDVLLVPLT